MTPPGLAFLAVSPAAWKQIESIPRPAFYFDLLAYRKALRESDTPYTPAIPLIKALAESLRVIQVAGIENICADQAVGPGRRGRGWMPGCNWSPPGPRTA